MRIPSNRLLAGLVVSMALLGCDGDGPLGLAQVEGEFRGSYRDVSTCAQPAVGSSPMTSWLHQYSPQGRSVRVALNFDEGGSIANADEHFQATLEPNGRLRGFAVDSHGELYADQEIDALLTGNRLAGRFYEHCDDGTADIGEFDLQRWN